MSDSQGSRWREVRLDEGKGKVSGRPRPGSSGGNERREGTRSKVTMHPEGRERRGERGDSSLLPKEGQCGKTLRDNGREADGDQLEWPVALCNRSIGRIGTYKEVIILMGLWQYVLAVNVPYRVDPDQGTQGGDSNCMEEPVIVASVVGSWRHGREQVKRNVAWRSAATLSLTISRP